MSRPTKADLERMLDTERGKAEALHSKVERLESANSELDLESLALLNKLDVAQIKLGEAREARKSLETKLYDAETALKNLKTKMNFCGEERDATHTENRKLKKVVVAQGFALGLDFLL